VLAFEVLYNTIHLSSIYLLRSSSLASFFQSLIELSILTVVGSRFVNTSMWSLLLLLFNIDVDAHDIPTSLPSSLSLSLFHSHSILLFHSEIDSYDSPTELTEHLSSSAGDVSETERAVRDLSQC